MQAKPGQSGFRRNISFHLLFVIYSGFQTVRAMMLSVNDRLTQHGNHSQDPMNVIRHFLNNFASLQGRQGRSGPTTSELFRSIWPVEERLEEFQNEDWVNEQTPSDMFEFKRIWNEKRRREEKGEETYRRDAPLPTKQFDGGPDNCVDLLHQSRQVFYLLIE